MADKTRDGAEYAAEATHVQCQVKNTRNTVVIRLTTMAVSRTYMFWFPLSSFCLRFIFVGDIIFVDTVLAPFPVAFRPSPYFTMTKFRWKVSVIDRAPKMEAIGAKSSSRRTITAAKYSEVTATTIKNIFPSELALKQWYKPDGMSMVSMWKSKKNDAHVVGWCSDTEAMMGMFAPDASMAITYRGRVLCTTKYPPWTEAKQK